MDDCTSRRLNGGFHYKVYYMLHDACVTRIADYSAPVTGYLQYDSSLQLHLRAIRAYLGVPRNACNPGVLSEVDLLLPRYRTNIAMIRQYHRMLSMDDTRLTKQIFLWDRDLNRRNIVTSWSVEVCFSNFKCNWYLRFVKFIWYQIFCSRHEKKLNIPTKWLPPSWMFWKTKAKNFYVV